MKRTEQNTENHLSPEEVALFDEFMDETSLLSTSKAIKNKSGAVSPESLLAVLNDAKKLAHSLRSDSVSNEQSEEINTRLTHIETELADLKQKIAKLVN